MKSVFVSAILFVALASCVAGKKSRSYYYHIDLFKEQEIKLRFLDNNTFVFSDLTGCNQFMFTGKYKTGHDSFFVYYILDSIVESDSLRTDNRDYVFKIHNGDTAWVINKERLVMQAQRFKISHNLRLNLQQIRVNLLQAHYIDLLGKDGFIQMLGEGKSVRVARKRLRECQMGDIDYSSED